MVLPILLYVDVNRIILEVNTTIVKLIILQIYLIIMDIKLSSISNLIFCAILLIFSTILSINAINNKIIQKIILIIKKLKKALPHACPCYYNIKD